MARGLNTIASRITKNEEALAQYGVAVKDSSGELRSTYDVLYDLSQQWGKMSDAEKTALGNSLAGVRQYPILSAVLQNFNTAVEATATAYNSAGSAERENEKYLDSLAGRTELLKAQFQELVLGQGGLQDFAKNLITLATNALKFINTMGGLPALLTTILGLVIAIKGEAILTMITEITGGITKFIAMIPSLISGIEGIATANMTLQASMGVFGAIIALVPIVVGLFNTIKGKIKDTNDTLEEFNSAQDKVSEIQSKINAIKAEMGETTDPQTLSNLKEENEYLESQLKYYQAISDEKKKQAEQEAEQALSKKRLFYNTDNLSPYSMGGEIFGYETGLSTLEKYTEQISYLQGHIANLKKWQSELNMSTEDGRKKNEEYQAQLDNYEKTLSKVISHSSQYYESIKSLFDLLSEKSPIFDKVKSILDKYTSIVGNASDNTEDLTNKTDDLNKQLEEQKQILQDDLSDLQAQQQEYERVFKFVEKQIDNEIGKIKDQKTAYDKSIDAQVKKIKEKINALKEENDVLDKQADKYQKVFDLVVKGVETDIKSLESQKDSIEKSYESLYNSTEKYYNDLIDQIKKSNEEQQKSIELQEKLESLAKAKSQKVMTFQESQWIYGENQQEVATAQSELDSYKKQVEYEKQLNDLENERDLKLAQINTQKDNEVAGLDFQIKKLEDYITKVEKLKTKYDDVADTKILKEYLKNGDIYDIKGLKKVEKQYENTQIKIKSNEDSIKGLESEIENLQKVQEAQDLEYDKQISKLESYKQTIDDLQLSYDKAFDEELLKKYGITFDDVLNGNITKVKELAKQYVDVRKQIEETQRELDSLNGNLSDSPKYTVTTKEPKSGEYYKELDKNGKLVYYVSAHASGISSISSDQTAIVGEDPNKEIVIGSKLNNGTLMNLPKGSGVVNAKSTNTLAGLLNSIGSFGSSNFGAGSGTINNNSNSTNSNTFNISKIEVKANNAQEFADSFRNFSMLMTQKAY